MDSFEKQNATDWQPSTRAKTNPPRSSGSSPRRPNYNRPSYAQSAQHTPPSLPVQRPEAQEALISFDEHSPRQVQTRPAQSMWNSSSNIFAALTNDDGNSSSSSMSTPPGRKPTTQLISITPSPTKTTKQRRIAHGSNDSQSNMDLLMELDEDPFVSSPFSGHFAIREASKSLLDEDIPDLSRGEDDAWFDAQSRGQSRQVSGPSSSRGRGSPRGRGEPPSRGSGHVLEENSQRHNSQAFVTHSPQVSDGDSQRARTHGSRGAHSHHPQASRGAQATRGHVPRPQTQFHRESPVSRVPGSMHGLHNTKSATPKPLAKHANDTKTASAKAAMLKPPQNQLGDAQKTTEAIKSEDLHLNTQVDTAATTEWRKNDKQRSGKVYDLPRLNLVGPSLDTKSSSKPVLGRVVEISVVTNTHIDAVWEGRAKLIIYGTSQAVEEARQLIQEWIEGVEAGMDDEKWAKVVAYNARAEKKLRKRLKYDEKRQIFRQSISGELPKHAATFPWPLRKAPESVLGSNLEALDPVRMNCHCYITCERGPPTVLKIQGNDEKKVQEALERMRHIPEQWHALAFEVEPFVILDVPYVSNPGTLPPVRQVHYHFPRPLHTQATKEDKGEDGVTFRFRYPATQEIGSGLDPDQSATARKLLQGISKTTQHARYFRGLLKMHIHLGTFVAKKALEGDIDKATYSYPHFADMMEDHDNMTARVSSEIGDSIVERHVLARCFEASHLLAPQDAWIFKLSDVQPKYAATFQIDNPASQNGDLFLDVELSYDGGVTNLVSKRWYQLRKGKKEPRALLDGSILSLKNGLAWHIGLDAFMAVDERGLSQAYQVFPDKLNLDIAAAASDDVETCHNFIGRPTDVLVKTVREKRCWRFNTTKGEWVVEVAQVGKWVAEVAKDGKITYTAIEPRWTFNLYNNNWDRYLASNNRTDIGEAADWGHGNPCNKLIPENPDTTMLTGTARQDRDDSDGSDGDETDAGIQEDPSVKPKEEAPSLRNVEQLLDLLRQLADVVVGQPGRVL